MAQVTITINNRPYTVACEDGQEPRLQELAVSLDREVAGLARAIGQVGDSRLLVISGLSLIDRLNEAASAPASTPTPALEVPDNSAEIAALEEQVRHAEERVLRAEAQAEALQAQLDAQLAEAARRIDALAAGLQGD